MAKRELDAQTRLMLGKRSSGAAGKHRDKRDKRVRTRGAAKARALREFA